jgi:hypothetical protein
MDREPPKAEDPLLRREEDAARAEAAAIGGPAPETEGDEAARPLEEAGQGEAEGFEVSERELVEQASHGEARWSPEADTFPQEGPADRPAYVESGREIDPQEFTPEGAADRTAPAYGEPDEIDPTEVTRDPQGGPDDPGEGPGLAAER